MITPTVGRILHYRPGPLDAIITNDKEPLAAIIAAVQLHINENKNEFYLVNLSVIDANGIIWNRRYVRLVQENEVPPPADSYCEWMPYQKQVAKGEIKPILHAIPNTPNTPPIQEGII